MAFLFCKQFELAQNLGANCKANATLLTFYLQHWLGVKGDSQAVRILSNRYAIHDILLFIHDIFFVII
jgi:hypothetical protein